MQNEKTCRNYNFEGKWVVLPKPCPQSIRLKTNSFKTSPHNINFVVMERCIFLNHSKIHAFDVCLYIRDLYFPNSSFIAPKTL